MKPWNPAYRDTWEAMTPAERRATARFDFIFIAVVIGTGGLLMWTL